MPTLESTHPLTMQKNGTIKFIIMWLADRNLQIDFNYSGHSKYGLISFVQNKFASNKLLITALKVALGRDWDLLDL